MVSEILIKGGLEKYFGKIYSIEKLKKGTSGNTFIIHAGKKYVFKTFEKKNKKSLETQIRQLRKINEKNEITINPVSSKVLGNDKFIGYAYEYFEGETYENSSDKNKLYVLGKLAGTFNKQAKPLTKPCKNNSIYKEVLKSYKENKEYFSKLPNSKEVIEIIDKELALLKGFDKKKFRSQIVHGDIHFQNILYTNNKFRIIDIDGLRERNVVFEPVTMLSFLLNYNNFEKNVKLFLKGYESEYKLLKEEKKAIPYFFLLRTMNEIIWFIYLLKKGFITLKQYNEYVVKSIKRAKIVMKDFDNLIKFFSKI